MSLSPWDPRHYKNYDSTTDYKFSLQTSQRHFCHPTRPMREAKVHQQRHGKQKCHHNHMLHHCHHPCHLIRLMHKRLSWWHALKARWQSIYLSTPASTLGHAHDSKRFAERCILHRDEHRTRLTEKCKVARLGAPICNLERTSPNNVLSWLVGNLLQWFVYSLFAWPVRSFIEQITSIIHIRGLVAVLKVNSNMDG